MYLILIIMNYILAGITTAFGVNLILHDTSKIPPKRLIFCTLLWPLVWIILLVDTIYEKIRSL